MAAIYRGPKNQRAGRFEDCGARVQPSRGLKEWRIGRLEDRRSEDWRLGGLEDQVLVSALTKTKWRNWSTESSWETKKKIVG